MYSKYMSQDRRWEVTGHNGDDFIIHRYFLGVNAGFRKILSSVALCLASITFGFRSLDDSWCDFKAPLRRSLHTI